MIRLPAPLFAAVLTMLGVASHAETLSCALRPGQPATVTIDSPVDDANFQDPLGYHHYGVPEHTLIRTLTLTNTGDVPLTGPLLVVNGRDWSSSEALRKSLGLTLRNREWIPRLFCFWRDTHSHAGGPVDAKKEPMALLNFWGCALCGDTTDAITRLATSYGGQARRIPLNGHVAAEYYYDGGWHVFDTDQNVFYLQLDNHTIASAADLRADPLLARRTKVFGRYAPIDAAEMTFNTSLHEYIAPKEHRPMKLKSPLSALRAETLYPGEQMIVHATEAPKREAGPAEPNFASNVRASSLRIVEWKINSAARRDASGQVVVATAYPILCAVNHTTGETITPAEVAFEIKLQTHTPTDLISVYCQRTRVSLPIPGKGRNSVLLTATPAQGAATLDVDWERPNSVVVPSASATLLDDAPSFQIRTEPAADIIHWEISAQPGFDLVPPNFDTVTEAAEMLHFDPLTATFFNPKQDYFLRVKARLHGVWGEWSAPVSFRVHKPARIAPIAVQEKDRRLHLSWPDGGAGTEYLVFGSNRLDFVPEIFTAQEIVKLRADVIEESRPNKNLVATVTTPDIDLEPSFRFYRIIARQTGSLSVPSDLIATPGPLAKHLPPAQVLQTRWRVVDGKNEYLATEMPLP